MRHAISSTSIPSGVRLFETIIRVPNKPLVSKVSIESMIQKRIHLLFRQILQVERLVLIRLATRRLGKAEKAHGEFLIRSTELLRYAEKVFVLSSRTGIHVFADEGVKHERDVALSRAMAPVPPSFPVNRNLLRKLLYPLSKKVSQQIGADLTCQAKCLSVPAAVTQTGNSPWMGRGGSSHPHFRLCVRREIDSPRHSLRTCSIARNITCLLSA